ncbi:DUF6301 family protein [Arachnia propionica]|uniref:Uncharacterized protein n=1 Tax=Arachnia propionica TaxID=1750 RepID=A0A3P1WJH6_9ACTN|nr:DUF6301 family protein [Arachnia propionica]RRD46779.1 hypothetical protein EII35_15430 [Arachnia propionica]
MDDVLRHISFETVRTWIERLVGLPAPVRWDDIPGLAAEFGWESTNIESRYRYEVEEEAQVVLVSGNGETGKLYNVNFDLVRNWEGNLLGDVAVADFFPRFVEAFSGVWGEPWSVMTDVDMIKFIWKFHEQGYAELTVWSDCVTCRFVTSDRTEERW